MRRVVRTNLEAFGWIRHREVMSLRDEFFFNYYFRNFLSYDFQTFEIFKILNERSECGKKVQRHRLTI